MGQRGREHKEIRQIKLFGVERGQFGKDRESETDRDGYGRRLWAYYVVLVFFISSCIFLIFLYFSCIWGWLREMVTGEGFGPTTYVVLVFFISSCIFFICLEFGDGYGRWLREMVTGEGFGPTT